MLFRYPGSKRKIAREITAIIKDFYGDGNRSHYEYREPFFGAGAVGFEVLKSVDLRRAWFNDRDPAIGCVWEQVLRDPQGLEALLCDFVPTVDRFFETKQELEAITSVVDVADRQMIALKKIAIHQLSYSGLGTMAGGPIGGREQVSAYGVGCRYSLPRLIKSIDKAAGLLGSVEVHSDVCSCLDFEEVIRTPGDVVLYLDPPYVEKGPDLYQFSFTEQDHVRLASVLRDEGRPWLLSYDKHPAIEELYGGWAELGEVSLTYSINGANAKTEYLIANDPLRENIREVLAHGPRTVEETPPRLARTPGGERDDRRLLPGRDDDGRRGPSPGDALPGRDSPRRNERE